MSHRPPANPPAQHDTSEQDPYLSRAEEHSADPLRGHNKRLSTVSAAPAHTYSPNVQVSLVQPGGTLRTPQPEDILHMSESAASMGKGRASLSSRYEDYFSHNAFDRHPTDPRDRGSTESKAQTSLSRQSTHSSEASGPSNPEHFHMETSLSQHRAYQREPLYAASSPHDKESEPRKLAPSRSVTEHPQYPNQALSALSSQIYPGIHQAPYSSRQGSGLQRPNKPTGVLSRISSPSNSGDERQARTVGNTPIATPHLFSPRLPRFTPVVSDDGESPIPSPYLHPVQPHAPKETNKATRDIDTSSGRKTINEYEILYEIGKGTHGKVKLARNMTTSEPVAIKIVQRYSKKRRLGKAQGQEDKVKKEVAILKKALHPNVVSMIEVIDDPDLHKIYLVLEFCEAHDVKWREIGETEIIILENRRLKQECRGAADSETTDTSNDRLLQAADRRRKRATQPRHVPLSRINSESQFFSLEYGGDSEPEEEAQPSSLGDSNSGQDDSRPIERIASSPRSAQAFESPSHISEAVGIPTSNPRPVHDSPLHSPEESPRPTFWNLQDFQHEMQRRMDKAIQNHGEVVRGRQSSVAESASSRLTEAMENLVEEEMRFVPLLTIAESRRAFRDAVLGLEYLHYHGIIHRDIKPENLLRKADHSVKISDFGVSYLGKPVRDGRDSEETSDAETSEYHEDEADLAKTVGTPAFYAPELCSLDYSPDRPRVTAQIDVWALGVTLYCFLYARLPFQANNEFVMMRHIDKQEPFISRRRLKAVDTHARSRPNSHGPLFRASKDHRLPHELLYDDIDDELYDLLRRLLIKDPTHRMTIKQIKHHPWVLRDIPQPIKWLDDTDPAKFTQGKKIEISQNDVSEAVAPLRFFERVKSVAKKVFAPSATSRKRGQSSAASSEVSSGSAGLQQGGSSFSGQDHSRSDDSIASASKTSREQQYHHQHPEHPLSQSVTASPEVSSADKQFNWSSPESATLECNLRNVREYERPHMPTRQESVMSTAGSVKTVTPSDFAPREQVRSRHPDSGPGPSGVEPQLPQSFGHMLGEAGRNLLRSVRSRDRAVADKGTHSTASSPRSSEHHESLQAEPSVAVSSTSASGHLSSIRDNPQRASPYSKRHSLALTPKEFLSHDEPPNADMREILTRRHMHYLEHTVSHGSGERLTHADLSNNPSFLQLSPSNPSPRSRPSQPTISSNSSEDRFNSALSRETSFPSVPSVISADSSVTPDVGTDEPVKPIPKLQPYEASKPRPASYHGTGRPGSMSTSAPRRPLVVPSKRVGKVAEDEQGVETDEDDSEEEFLIMNKTKSRSTATPKISARSGSTNTVRKWNGRERHSLTADDGQTQHTEGKK